MRLVDLPVTFTLSQAQTAGQTDDNCSNLGLVVGTRQLI